MCVCVCGGGGGRIEKDKVNLGEKGENRVGRAFVNFTSSSPRCPGKPDLYVPALKHPSVPTVSTLWYTLQTIDLRL